PWLSASRASRSPTRLLAAELSQPPLEGRHALVHLFRQARGFGALLRSRRFGRGRRTAVTVHAAGPHAVFALAHGLTSPLRPAYRRDGSATSTRKTPWRRPPGSGASFPETAPAGRRSASARRGRSRPGGGNPSPTGSCADRCSPRAGWGSA